MELEEVLSLVGLYYKGCFVGVRVITTRGTFDIDREALIKAKVSSTFRPSSSFSLTEVDGLLLSKDEIETGNIALDISEYPDKVLFLIEILRKKPKLFTGIQSAIRGELGN